MRKVISLIICFSFIFQQTGFCQVAGQVDLAGTLAGMYGASQDRYRPVHLRYLSYDGLSDHLNLLLDQGDVKKETLALEDTTQKLINYFFVGISLPNESFWVNLRPDSPKEVIDDYLGKTDMGRVMLEADLQLKKDTARFTSPETKEGRAYWDKLYKKAEEIYGKTETSIPTITRPWIVPDEIIVREDKGSVYIYKGTMKVMLEQDYLKGSVAYGFKDERQRQLNEYSSELIRQTILPKVTKDINSAERYAQLRQVYFSLILAHWFKGRYAGQQGEYSKMINSKQLAGLTSKTKWDKSVYFKAYRKSFAEGEYNIKTQAFSSGSAVIRQHFSGGIVYGGAPVTEAYGRNRIDLDNIGKRGFEDRLPNTAAVDVTGAPGQNVVTEAVIPAVSERDGGSRGNPLIRELPDFNDNPLNEIDTPVRPFVVTELPDNDRLRRQAMEGEFDSHRLLKGPIGFSLVDNLEGAPEARFYLVVRQGVYSVVRASSDTVFQLSFGTNQRQAEAFWKYLDPANDASGQGRNLADVNSWMQQRGSNPMSRIEDGMNAGRVRAPAREQVFQVSKGKPGVEHRLLLAAPIAFSGVIENIDGTPEATFNLAEANGEFWVVRTDVDGTVSRMFLGNSENLALRALLYLRSATGLADFNTVIAGGTVLNFREKMFDATETSKGKELQSALDGGSRLLQVRELLEGNPLAEEASNDTWSAFEKIETEPYTYTNSFNSLIGYIQESVAIKFYVAQNRATKEYSLVRVDGDGDVSQFLLGTDENLALKALEYLRANKKTVNDLIAAGDSQALKTNIEAAVVKSQTLRQAISDKLFYTVREITEGDLWSEVKKKTWDHFERVESFAWNYYEDTTIYLAREKSSGEFSLVIANFYNIYQLSLGTDALLAEGAMEFFRDDTKTAYHLARETERSPEKTAELKAAIETKKEEVSRTGKMPGQELFRDHPLYVGVSGDRDYLNAWSKGYTKLAQTQTQKGPTGKGEANGTFQFFAAREDSTNRLFLVLYDMSTWGSIQQIALGSLEDVEDALAYIKKEGIAQTALLFLTDLNKMRREMGIADGGSHSAGAPSPEEEKAAMMDRIGRSSGPTADAMRKQFGGIDFRQLPITMQTATALLNEIAGMKTVAIVNLDAEMKSMRKMIRANMCPSTRRIKEFLGACYRKGEFDSRAEEMLACLAEVMKKQEEECKATEPDLKTILVLLEVKR